MNWLPPFPVVIPLLVAAGFVAAAPVCRRRIADSVAIGTGLAVTLACLELLRMSCHGTIVYWFGNWLPRGNAAIGISFAIDPVGAGMAALSALLVTVAMLYSWEYFDAVRTYFHAMMMIFLAAMVGFCLTGDLFNLFVFFELMSVTAYALTGYKVEEKQALAGAMNFAVTNSVGGFMVLIGIALVYGRTGALNMAQAGLSLSQHPCDRLIVVAITLIFCGFFVKAAAVPFHFWLADAHAVAPTPVCVLFSGVMIELGLFGGFRTFWTVFHPVLAQSDPHLRQELMVWGAFSATVGAIMCYWQRHLKRLLAFSSISHVGMMLVGAGCLTAKGFAGASLYVIGHALIKGALFMCAGLLLHRFGSVDIYELFGRGKKTPILTATFLVAGLGLAGFPPFGLYLGKAMMEDAGKELGVHWLPWLFLFCSALTGGAVLRAGGMIFFGWGRCAGQQTHAQTARGEKLETKSAHRSFPAVMLSAAVLFTILPIASGCFGSALTSALDSGAIRFTDQPLYARTVMTGQPTGPADSGAPTNGGLAMGLAAAGGAIAMALFGLFGGRLPGREGRRTVFHLFDPLRRILFRVHSGHIGDLIVWLIIGVVAVGMGFAAVAASH